MKDLMQKFMISLLCAVVLFTGVSGTVMGADTSSKEQRKEAVKWLNRQCGKGFDYDHAYGLQCVDFLKYYYMHLGEGVRRGNAKDYIKNTLPAGWKRQKISSANFYMKPGDIVIWTGSKYGHVGVCVKVGEKSFTVVDQNGKGHNEKVARHVRTYSSTVWGVIHPVFNVVKSPKKTKITSASYSAKKSQVKIKWKKKKGSDTYNVYRRQAGKKGYELIANDVKQKKYTDTSVKKNTKYYYKITTENELGESNKSESFAVSTEVSKGKTPSESADAS